VWFRDVLVTLCQDRNIVNQQTAVGLGFINIGNTNRVQVTLEISSEGVRSHANGWRSAVCPTKRLKVPVETWAQGLALGAQEHRRSRTELNPGCHPLGKRVDLSTSTPNIVSKTRNMLFWGY
jgi:hypothetical protein